MQSFQARSLIWQILKCVGYATIKNQSRNLLQISLVLNKRSITQLLLLMTIPKFGKCQQQSISIPVDCHMQPPWWIRMHTCAWQAHEVSHLLAYPSLLSDHYGGLSCMVQSLAVKVPITSSKNCQQALACAQQIQSCQRVLTCVQQVSPTCQQALACKQQIRIQTKHFGWLSNILVPLLLVGILVSQQKRKQKQ